MTTKQIRWSRIIKHSIQYFFTLNKIYKYEIEHYYYMVKFKANKYEKIQSMA